MFLESLFLYVWMECPKGVYNPEKRQGRTSAEKLENNFISVR